MYVHIDDAALTFFLFSQTKHKQHTEEKYTAAAACAADFSLFQTLTDRRRIRWFA